MSVTDEEYAAWLRADHKRRIVLVEAQHSEGTEYFSDYPYVTGPSETPANQPYDDLLLDAPLIHRSFERPTSVSRLKVANLDGERDAWLNLAWAGWPINLYLGDATWARADFRCIYTGIIATLAADGRSALSIATRDNRDRLKTKVQTNRVTGTGALVPLCLGSCFNISPILIDEASLIYQVHDGAVSAISAVRDNGVVVAKTNDLTHGKFTLSASPAGKITADVVGASDGTATGMITWIIERVAGTGLIDEDNFADFPNAATLGLYLDREINADQAVNDICDSVGASLLVSREGLFELHRFEAPAVTAALELDQDDVFEGKLEVAEVEPPKVSISLEAARNWTPQSEGELAGYVTDIGNQELYQRAGVVVTATNSGVAADYPLARADDTIRTLFSDEADAQDEADRRAAIRVEPHFRYKATLSAASFQVGIGDTLNLTHPRFGLSGGENCLVIGLSESPSNRTCELELWR